jgi:hypothetical protein
MAAARSIQVLGCVFAGVRIRKTPPTVYKDRVFLLGRMVEEQSHRDDEGRPLREGRTPAELLHPDDIEYKACPFSGSRAVGLPMNVSALRQISAHWDAIIDTVATLRIAYEAAVGRHPPEVIDLWRVSQLGSALPWFHVLRDRVAPAYAAGLAKVTLGVGLWGQAVLVEQLAGKLARRPLDPQVILELAELTGTLVGETEVCSASDKMVVKFFEPFFAGEPAAFDPFGADRDAILELAAHYTNLKLALWVYWLARRFLYADLAAAGADVTELLDGPVEPPDFFAVGPPDMAAVAPPLRAAWIHQLAELIVPLAGTDLAIREAAQAMARALAQDTAPEALVAEAGPAARALATYARLDTIFAELCAHVEGVFRRTTGAPPLTGPIEAATRDRLLATPPRERLYALAPTALPPLCPP